MRHIILTVSSVMFVLLLSIPALAIQNVIVLDLETHRDGNIDIIDYYLDEGDESLELVKEPLDYMLEIYSSDNRLIYSRYFKISFDIHADVAPGESPPEGQVINKSEIILRAPYLENNVVLKLFHNGKLVEEKMVSFCNNNNVCEPNAKENFLGCEIDCPSGSIDDYCDKVLDGICDLDCSIKEFDIDCTCGNNICDIKESGSTCPKDCSKSVIRDNSFYIFSIIGIVIGFGILFSVKKIIKKR